MNYFDATIYGIIQGLTEFLPVSSSAHLALLPHVMQIDDPGVFFDLSMHIGTALAVLIYFRKMIFNLLKSFFTLNFTPYLKNVCLALFCTGVPALFLKDILPQFGRTEFVLATNLIIFGLIMYLADRSKIKFNDKHLNEKLDIKRSIFIGLMQVLSLCPGVSRSGITMTAARFSGLSRSEAASFSFILALPLIFGGFILELPHALQSNVSWDFYLCLWGVIVSFFVGLLGIHFLLKLVKKTGFYVFTIYRIIIGLLIYLTIFF